MHTLPACKSVVRFVPSATQGDRWSCHACRTTMYSTSIRHPSLLRCHVIWLRHYAADMPTSICMHRCCACVYVLCLLCARTHQHLVTQLHVYVAAFAVACMLLTTYISYVGLTDHSLTICTRSASSFADDLRSIHAIAAPTEC